MHEQEQVNLSTFQKIFHIKPNFYSRYDYVKHKPCIFTENILRFAAGRSLDSLALVCA